MEAVAAVEDRRARTRMHRAAIGSHKGDAAVLAVEDDLVVAHVGRAEDGAIVLIVEDTKAPPPAA